MSTRATICFRDEFGWEVFVYRHSDGCPGVMTDLKIVLEAAVGRWHGSELGLLIALFFGRTFRSSVRVQDYCLAPGWAGDEDHRYLVTWDREGKRWTVSEKLGWDREA